MIKILGDLCDHKNQKISESSAEIALNISNN